jgi:RimJ/RimL family protein N-acetyltransferase
MMGMAKRILELSMADSRTTCRKYYMRAASSRYFSAAAIFGAGYTNNRLETVFSGFPSCERPAARASRQEALVPEFPRGFSVTITVCCEGRETRSCMRHETNELGQPVGFALPDWKPPQSPAHAPIEGRYCILNPLNPDVHAEALHAANVTDTDGGMWTYMAYGPFATLDSYRLWADGAARGSDPLFFAIVDRATGKAAGVASYLRIDPANGCIEVGHLAYSPLLQRKSAATEAMYLMMENAFNLGYRRYEWKCNSLNKPSRTAAQRLGFSYEGVFRQATVVKGRNRDTAWYSVIDEEWPALQAAYQAWLAPGNFNVLGKQRMRLSSLTGPLLKQRG